MASLNALTESLATGTNQDAPNNQATKPKSWNAGDSGNSSFQVSVPSKNQAHLTIPANRMEFQEDSDTGNTRVSYSRFASLRERAAKNKAAKSSAKWMLGGVALSAVAATAIGLAVKAGLIGLAVLAGPWVIAGIAAAGLAWVALSAYKGGRAAGKERALWDDRTAGKIDRLASTVRSSGQDARALRGERDALRGDLAQLRNRFQTTLDNMHHTLQGMQGNNGVQERLDTMNELLETIQRAGGAQGNDQVQTKLDELHGLLEGFQKANGGQGNDQVQTKLEEMNTLLVTMQDAAGKQNDNGVQNKLEEMHGLLKEIQNTGVARQDHLKTSHDELTGTLRNIQKELEQYKVDLKKLAANSDGQTENHGQLSDQLNTLTSTVENISKEINTAIGTLSKQMNDEKDATIERLTTKVQSLQTYYDANRGFLESMSVRAQSFTSPSQKPLSARHNSRRSSLRPPGNQRDNSNQLQSGADTENTQSAPMLGRSASHSPKITSNSSSANTSPRLNTNSMSNTNPKTSKSGKKSKSNNNMGSSMRSRSKSKPIPTINTKTDSNNSATTTGNNSGVTGNDQK